MTDASKHDLPVYEHTHLYIKIIAVCSKAVFITFAQRMFMMKPFLFNHSYCENNKNTVPKFAVS